MTTRTLDKNQIQHRELLIRSADSDKREFTGLGVPYGEVIEHFFGAETFDRGSIEGADEARVLWQHREPIGVITGYRETDAGFEVTGKISETERGNEAMTLLKDGVIRSLSIGFEPLEYSVEKREGQDDLLHFTRVKAREFSLVTFPAYDSATIDTIRTEAKEDRMPTTDTLTREDLNPLSDGLEDLKREMALLGTNRDTTPDGAQFRSMGDLLKALARGDEAALEFHRAYTGATTADTVMKPAFLGDYVKLVDERRKIVNQFNRGTLPSDGMSVDYYQLDADETKVGEQVNEGDDLIYGKLTLKEANAPVKTYGGWTELTRQAIERATVPALNITLRALALRYARVTNVAVATRYAQIIQAHLAAYNDALEPDSTRAVSLPAGADATAWLNMIVDAALRYEDRGFEIGGLNVTADVFKQLNALKDGDRRLMRVYGDGSNQVGELNLTQVSGNLAGVKVTLLPNTAGSVASFYDPVAIETLESPNAPAQLQDDNIINLSKQFSVYGYQAVLSPFENAIVPIDFEA